MRCNKAVSTACAVGAGWLAWTGTCVPITHAQVTQTIYNTPLPAVIRVAIRGLNPWGEPDPRGPIQWVQTVPFYDYCADVLPNEWMPSWDPASLRAGAVAVRMFAWYHHLHPVTLDGFTFDVDNTVNFQTFLSHSGQPSTDQALMAMNNIAYTLPGGVIAALDYRAGYEDSANWEYAQSQKMAQWGSQYLASTGLTFLQILQFYYPGRQLLYI